jgi:hypothetical protein
VIAAIFFGNIPEYSSPALSRKTGRKDSLQKLLFRVFYPLFSRKVGGNTQREFKFIDKLLTSEIL